MRILIVEDEALVAMAIKTTLQDAGYDVIGPFASARKANDALSGGCPDLALVDINLLDGKGAGIGLARTLMERCGLRSLFVSGQVKEAYEHRDAALGYLSKPYGTDALLASVEIGLRIIAGEADAKPCPGLVLFHPELPKPEPCD